MANDRETYESSPAVVPKRSFIEQAERLKPVLLQRDEEARQNVEVVPDERAIHGWRAIAASSADTLAPQSFGKGDAVILDFGDHRVGYVSLDVKPVGSPPDAPLRLKLTFGEMPVEVAEPLANYNGWISSSWLQEETITVDVLPCRIEMPRRYSFRYLKLEVLDTSRKYRVAFDRVLCRTVTSADPAQVVPLVHADPLLTEIDRVSVRTLEDCMQDVFEDGPKRDRRLWLGDLRLQALANYETFRNYDLVKRCLYLFASVPDERGRVTSNLFIEPGIIADDTYFWTTPCSLRRPFTTISGPAKTRRRCKSCGRPHAGRRSWLWSAWMSGISSWIGKDGARSSTGIRS